jgi:hypothetical protein
LRVIQERRSHFRSSAMAHDSKAGWKGRGLWASTGRAWIWHAEGGKGQTPQMVHVQLRPDPLAKCSGFLSALAFQFGRGHGVHMVKRFR